MAASDSFKVRFHESKFWATMLVDQETRHVKISEGSQQTHHLVFFAVSWGDNRHAIRLCFPDSAINRYKEQNAQSLLHDEQELKQIFSQEFSESGPNAQEFFVSDTSRRR